MTTLLEKQEIIVDKFLKSSLGKKFEADMEKETLEKRWRAVEAIDRLKKEREETTPRLIEALERERGKVKQAEEKLKVAQKKCEEAQRAVMAQSNSYSTQIARHECALRESADPAIDKFRRELDELYQTIRNAGPRILKWDHLRDKRTLKVFNEPVFDRQGLQDDFKTIEDAFERMERLKITCVEDVSKAIDEIRQTLPQAYSTHKLPE